MFNKKITAMRKCIIASIIGLLINVSGFGQSVNKEAFNDFTNHSKFPAFNEELILNIKGDSVAG